MRHTVIALDVGGASVKSSLVEANRQIRARRTTPIDSQGPADAILDTLAGIIVAQSRQLRPNESLAGIGVGFPGPFDYAQGVCYIQGVAKYDSLFGLDIRAELGRRLPQALSLPILFRNDAEAAILGEFRYGAGKHVSRGIGVTLGTGCGSAFVANGVPQTSGPGVPPKGWLYAEPWQGRQADDVFSTRGLRARLAAAGAESLDIPQAAQAARQGDQGLQAIFASFGADLGAFLQPYVAGFGAQVVLLLGGIAQAYDLFGPATAQTAGVPVLPGALGPDAALLGAADLIFDLVTPS